jgi:hypothetical protein
MKFRIEHRFEGGPFDEVVRFMTEEYMFDATNLPNVKGYKLLEEKIFDDRKVWRNEWCAHGQIPKVIQHLIQPKMLTWIEETTYDRKTRIFYTKITPFYFRNIFFCENRGYFIKKSDREFMRVQEGVLDIKISVFGPFIEEQIIAHLRQNMNEEYKVTFKKIKEKYGGAKV